MKTVLALLFFLPISGFSQENIELERNPEFPGGIAAMTDFFAKNIKYPKISKELGEFGQVILEFVVNKDGSIGEINVIRGVSRNIDKEGIRLVKAIPNWIPAQANGENVNANIRIPINFVLPTDK